RASMRVLIEAATLTAAVALAWQITRRFPDDRLTRLAAASCIIAGAPLVMTMLTAQPAYLIGMAGIGSVLLAKKNQRLAASILVALVAMKPHIALPFYGLLFWKWRSMRSVILLGAALTLALTLVAEALLGFGATVRFITAARDAAAGVTSGGHYIQERLLPLVTALRAIVPPTAITPLHLAIAASAFTLITVTMRKTAAPQRILALSGVSTLWLSPYLYDYDLGLAVLCILIYAGASTGNAAGITALTVVATLLGLSGLAVKLLQPVMDLSLLRGWNMAAPVLLTALAVWPHAPKNQCAASGCDDTHTPVNTPPFDIAKK
ncbi:MAG: glycosyltransferase 87 family protein, partial [Beijerinckiaceae bacterium]